jgi:two-component system OmpR family sensor kinase
MKSWSLVSRLIWGLSATLAALWLLGSVATGLLTTFEVNERLDNALQEVAQRLTPATVDVADDARAMRKMADQLAPMRDPRALAYQIVGRNGQVMLRSENAPSGVFVLPLQLGFADTANYRVFTQPTAIGAYVIEVAEPLIHRREAIHRSIFLSVAPVLVFLPLSWGLIIWIVRRSTRPLLYLQQEIRRRDGTNLTPIPFRPMPRELAAIQTAVNRFLARIEVALSNERQFAANSAHELRTPIAAVLAQAQLLASQLVETPHVERARLIVRQIKRLGALAEKLLQLSRVGASLALQREIIDVMPILLTLMEDFRRQSGVYDRIRLLTDDGGTLIVKADIDAVGIAIRNLLENAMLYGSQDEPIDVLIEANHILKVRNGCPAIAPGRLETLRKPFQRGTTIGQGGGLGLAIVDSVMAQIGGRLDLTSPLRGHEDGFEAALIFPSPAQSPAPAKKIGAVTPEASVD